MTAHAQSISWRFFPDECLTDSGLVVHQPSRYEQNSITDLVAEAEQLQQPFNKFGEELAKQLQGSFVLGPNKTAEQALHTILRQEPLLPEEAELYGNVLTDYLRGCIIVEDNHGIVRARKKLREMVAREQDIILRIEDRTSRPPSTQLRGIFIAARIPGQSEDSHITEIQIHTRAYWESLAPTHDLYKTRRALALQQTLHSMKPLADQRAWRKGEQESGITAEWNDESRAESRRARNARVEALKIIAATTKIDELELRKKGFEGDCSFPRRPAIKNGQQGALIASGYEGVFVKEGYNWYDPTWNPSKGIDPEYLKGPHNE